MEKLESPRPRRRFNFLDAIEKPTEWTIRLCGWSGILAVTAVFLSIFKEARPMLPRLDWIHFCSSSRWIPAPGGDNPPSFGALALIAGTISTTVLALAIAVPVGLGAAIYISEFAQGKAKEALKVLIE